MMMPATGPIVDPSAKQRLLITVHGIRTFGAWQGALKTKAEDDFGGAVEVCNYRYGFYSLVAFLIPFTRWIATRRFRKQLLHDLTKAPWSRVDIVAHSFGTHLVGWGLRRLPIDKQPLIHTIIFAGSVLKSTFPVRDLKDRAVRLVNDCGIKDNVLLVNQIFVLFTGMAGRIGLIGTEGPSFLNRFFDFGHGGYFDKQPFGEPDFMDKYWMPLLRSEAGIDAHDERVERALDDVVSLFLNNAEPIKIAVYVLPLLLMIGYVNNLRLAAVREAKMELARRLANESDLLRIELEDLEPPLLLATESMERIALPENDRRIRDAMLLGSGPRWTANLGGDYVTSVVFSDDGRLAAVRDSPGMVYVLDVATGRELLFLRTLGSANVAFIAGTRYLAVDDGLGKFLKIFEVATGREVKELAFAHYRSIRAISPDGRYVVVYPYLRNNSVKIIELTTGHELVRLKVPPSVNETNYTFSPNSRYLATWSRDENGVAAVFDLKTAKRIWRLAFSKGVRDLGFNVDGGYVAIARDDGSTSVFDLAAGSEALHLASGGTAVAISPDGYYLAVYNDRALRIIDAETSTEVLRFRRINSSGSIAISPNSHFVAVGGYRTIGLYEVNRTYQSTLLISPLDALLGVAFSKDGQHIATAGQDHVARVFEAATGKEISHLAEGDSVNGVDFSPDGRYVATASADRTVRIFESATGKEIFRLTEPKAVQAIAFNPDGKSLAVGCSDGNLRIIDVRNGKENLRVSEGGTPGPLVFSPDGRFIAMDVKGIRVVDATTGNEVTRNRGECGAEQLVFSPDGEFVAGACNDYTARVFDAKSGTEVLHLSHQSRVEAVAFSPDGHYLVSGSNDHTARIFDAGNGSEKIHLTNVGNVQAVHYSLDGSSLMTASLSREGEKLIVGHYMLKPETLIAEACSHLTRNLTIEEWKQYVGIEIPYHKTCSNLP
jgi:WD40 repeat protein